MAGVVAASRLLVACVVAIAVTVPANEARAETQDASALLKTLRQHLDRAALARRQGERFDIRDLPTSPPDVATIVGISRQVLLDALGPSTVDCRRTPVRNSITGQLGRIAPCRLEDDLVYSFHALPKGSGGGGTELLVQFEGRATCTRAQWVRTQ